MIYSIELKLAATAYIRADSKEQAQAILKKELEAFGPPCIEVLDGNGEIPISDLPLADPDLPEFSLSPAMTVIGVFDNAELECELEESD